MPIEEFLEQQEAWATCFEQYFSVHLRHCPTLFTYEFPGNS